MREFLGRIVRSILPTVLKEGSLECVLQMGFGKTGDERWLENLPHREREQLLEWILTSVSKERCQAFLAEAAEAMGLLGNLTASILLRQDISLRSPAYSPLTEHPMIRLENLTWRMTRQFQSIRVDDFRALEQNLEECRSFLNAVRRQMEEKGVSLDLVFQIERVHVYLLRIRELGHMIAILHDPHSSEKERTAVIWGLFVKLVRGEHQDRRPGSVIAQSLQLLALKTVERAGETGEEGIAYNQEGRRTFFLAARE